MTTFDTQQPTADETVTALANLFPPADAAQWRALVDKALKGAAFEARLVTRTADGLPIAPLYTRADFAADLADTGHPGAAPFTRGLRATPDGLGWQIAALIEAGDPASANLDILAELEGGANAIRLVVAAPGQSGVTVTSAADWRALLAGVHLDLAPLDVAAGLGQGAAVRALIEALPMLDGASGRRRLVLGLDPIGSYARRGVTSGGPSGVPSGALSADIADAVSLARQARATEPAAHTVRVGIGHIAHEAGASEGQEIAVTAAAFVAYLRLFEAAGVSPADAVAQMAIDVAADADVFATTAKLRALRTVLTRVAEACGAGAAIPGVRITAVTSARMMAQRDPWTNMLRTTLATAGAAFGGADAILTLPFTHALGLADPFARRIARNQQIVAQEESGLGRIVDPAGGAWFVERATADLAGAAWGLFQEIEREGGILAALRSGAVQARVAVVAAARTRTIATGRMELTGVSAYPRLGDDGVRITPRAQAAPLPAAPEIAPLTPVRLAAPFEALRDRADRAPAPPTVFLASLGTAADHTARSTWIINTLASGGIATVGAGIDHATAATVAEAFAASGAAIAVVASSDAVYTTLAEPVALALKAVGAAEVAVAGRPGDREAAYRAAGIDRFLHAGQDQPATLSALLDALGVPAATA